MKIGKPVSKGTIPPRNARASKYSEIYAAAAELGDSQSLPVEFDSLIEARTFAYGQARKMAGCGLRCAVRDRVVFVSKNGSNP